MKHKYYTLVIKIKDQESLGELVNKICKEKEVLGHPTLGMGYGDYISAVTCVLNHLDESEGNDEIVEIINDNI